ncbi:MAG: T9SS type A sorting domain-containing protein [Phaeodactylibacter xiamenensis]|nr:T9SS type A sorting domain-containing protein [Phaeodactylibacter xiamenensis]MCR9051917.1 alpha/beta hydrolase-fold protein [bacterium]
MHRIFFLFLMLLPFFTRAQQTINYSILVDSVQREFILYVPASYNGNTSVPLVFSFHGLGGNAQAQMEDHDFRPVADTAGFIVAHPLGDPVIGPGIRGWNFGNDALPDDVLFTSEMIDTIAADFNINLDRVYACGMSYGGFFSVFLAGQLSDRIAAIASVAGTILNNVPDTLISLTRPIAFLEIHGTNDFNVPYNGNQLSKSVQYVLDLFVDHNNCNTSPSITPLPDINPNDGSTVEHYIYANGDDGTTVEHLKVDGGGHTWPDENTNAQGVNRDINGCVEIWKFFSRFDMNGFIGAPVTTRLIDGAPTISVYPNPAQEYITIEIKNPRKNLRVYNYWGQEFNLPTRFFDEKIQIDIRSIPTGIYMISSAFDGGLFKSTTFIKQ